MGSCPDSHQQHASGIRRWLDWHKAVYGTCDAAFPPRVPDLVAYADVFRCEGTFQNYLGSIKLACEAHGLEVQAFTHPSVKRAKVSVAKRGE